ncbi:MAG: hypothetical protein J6J17_03375 [Bacilli bacterium]|nr:hypothetical protein [Bacilli bacterium]
MIEKDNKKEYESFNLYYMNLNKVYEISMMINNVIVSSCEKETGNIIANKKYKKSSIEGQIDSKYLASVKSILETGNSKEKVSSSKMIEKLDIKTTKSILLKTIKNKTKEITDLDKCKEGELVLLKNVKLSILDKKNLRQMLLLKRDALKGIQVEGIEINNIISSMIKDYSYILSGSLKSGENNQQFVIKIPFEIENEFENNYSVDDIILGNVSVIGIYKNKNNIEDIANNTLNYFSNNDFDNRDTKFFKSSKQDIKNNNDYDGIKEAHYIDVIGIIQEIKFNDLIPAGFWNRIKSFFRRNKNEK